LPPMREVDGGAAAEVHDAASQHRGGMVGFHGAREQPCDRHVRVRYSRHARRRSA
jgi:hypothetical protein